MARLNEPPAVSTDSLETLRRKLLRQNRDLAKSNNIRALRIRELENECACMLSENVAMRGRIIELEKQLEDNESQRIADHALAIKAKMEAQLTEWGTMLASLGLEPPPKRHSPTIRRTGGRRTSFAYGRVSPSQRRLRDLAREIEDLGYIPEYKQYSRKTLNSEEILAMRLSDASTADSTDLGPPPMSQFIDQEPTKVDSPRAVSPLKDQCQTPPQRKMEPLVLLPSPKPDTELLQSQSPEKKFNSTTEKQQTREVNPMQELKSVPIPIEEIVPTPTKAGMKRKLASRDENVVLSRKTDENKPVRALAGKSLREKTSSGMSLKDLASMRKDGQDETSNTRKALAAKSTNNDVTTPQKPLKSTKAAAMAMAADLVATQKPEQPPKSRATSRSKSKTSAPVKLDVTIPEIIPPAVCDLANTISEPELLVPISPESVKAAREDTPPLIQISTNDEPARPSRRSRAAVSYAEPNLRDKMRRPGKELVDAVVNRRSSHVEVPATRESVGVKSESDADTESMNRQESAPDSLQANSKEPEKLLAPVTTERKKRQSATLAPPSYKDDSSIEESTMTEDEHSVDLYEIRTSPKLKTSEGKIKSSRNKTRRFSAAVETEDGGSAGTGGKGGASTRRRSMMV